MSNQRQIAIVTNTYITDHQEYFPIGMSYTGNWKGNKVSWRNRLDTMYLSKSYDIYTSKIDYRGQSEIFGCPDFPQGTRLDNGTDVVFRTYTANAGLMVTIKDTDTVTVYMKPPARINQVITPQAMGMVAEHPDEWKSTNAFIGKFAMDDITEGPTTWHQGSMNANFVDGHGANFKDVDQFQKYKGTNVNNASWALIGGERFNE